MDVEEKAKSSGKSEARNRDSTLFTLEYSACKAKSMNLWRLNDGNGGRESKVESHRE